MKKAVGIYVLCAALLAGCSTGHEKKSIQAQTQEVTKHELVLVLPDNKTASGKYRIDTFQKYVTKFETANPNVDIKIEKIGSQKDLDARLEEGSQMDLIFWPFYPLLAEKGIYADLLPFFKADRMTTDDLYESLIKMSTTNGKLNGIPLSPRPLAVYYNKEWFDNAGISYPGSEWTWEQYFDLSIKLKSANTDANKEVFGSTIPFELTFIETLAQSSGGSLLSPDNKSVSGYLDSRPVSEAFALLAHHLSTDNAVRKVANMGNPTLSEMTAGNVGMSISFYGMNYFLEQNKRTTGKTAVAPLPHLEKGKKVNSSTFSTLSVAAASKQKEIAWKFIKDEILNSDSEFHRDWSRQEMLTSKAAIKKLNQAEDPILKVFYEELNYAIIPTAYRNPAFPSLFTVKTVQSLLDTPSADAAQAFLTDTARKIDEQLVIAEQQQKK